MANIIRIWKDELDRLPEYSYSNPTGICAWKTWKRRVNPGIDEPPEFVVVQYAEIYPQTMYTYVHKVVLLQGPRPYQIPALRFKTQCGKGELR